MESGGSPIATSDDRGAAARALALLDAVYDDLCDEEIAYDGPVDASAHRLVALAHRLVDDLPRRLAGPAGARREGGSDRATGSGDPAAPLEVAAIDTARIVALDRPQLEELAADLIRHRGGTVGVLLVCLTDDELRTMVRALR